MSAFHNAIYAGSQNDYIAEITLATRVRVQPFRRAQFRNLGRLAKSHAEHDRVVVAIMRGDRVGAGRRNAGAYRTGARRIRTLCGVAVEILHPAAINARQPLKAEISRAPSIAAGSTIKPLTLRPSEENDGADRHRRRNRGDEFAERGSRERPDLQFDRRPRTRRDAQQGRVSAAWCRAHRACSRALSWWPPAIVRRATSIRC